MDHRLTFINVTKLVYAKRTAYYFIHSYSFIRQNDKTHLHKYT